MGSRLRPEKTFFLGKRPWSKIKDQVLGSYMTPYLAKVSKLGRPILVVDAFAGPGKFEDGTDGSPLIICQSAEKQIPNQYQAMFVNRDKDHHQKLSETLEPFVRANKAVAIFGTAESLLERLSGQLTNQTVFLYLDPFNLRGWDFSTIEPFLSRDKRFSTEIVINLSIPAIHRLAARKTLRDGRRASGIVVSFHNKLTKVLGGDYWKDILWSETGSADDRAENLMALYRRRLQQAGLPYVGSCPVREREDSTLKYYITLCSRHPDALLLMNDIMCRAYNKQTYDAMYAGTLFEKTDWKESRQSRNITAVVKELAAELPGRSRSDIWLQIVQRHFMLFLESEYREAVKALCDQKSIRFEDVKKTGRLNDSSRLHLMPTEND